VRNSLTFSCSTPEESAVKGCALAYALKIRVDSHSLWLIRMPHRLVLLRVETAISDANNSFAMLKLLENRKIALRRTPRANSEGFGNPRQNRAGNSRSFSKRQC